MLKRGNSIESFKPVNLLFTSHKLNPLGSMYLLPASLNLEAWLLSHFIFRRVSILTSFSVSAILSEFAGSIIQIVKKNPNKPLLPQQWYFQIKILMQKCEFQKMTLHGCCSWQWAKSSGQVARPGSGSYTKQNINTTCRIIFCLELEVGSCFIISLQEVLYDLLLLYLLLVVLWASAG